MDKNEAISALEAFQYADRKTAAFYESQKRLATEHAVFEDTGKNEAVRAASRRKTARDCCLPVSRCCASAPRKRPRTIRPSARCSHKKEELERKIDTLKYQKAAMSAGRLQEAADRRAAGTGASAGGAGQVKRALATRARCLLRALCCAAAAGAARWGATPDDCHAAAQARPSRRSAEPAIKSLTRCARSLSARRRLSGAWRCTRRPTTNFAPPWRRSTSNAMYRVRWGRCCTSGSITPTPRICSRKRLQSDPKNAQAYLGLALVSADGFDSKAIE